MSLMGWSKQSHRSNSPHFPRHSCQAKMGFTKAGDAPCRLMPRRWRAVFPPVISGMPRQTLVPGTSYIRTLQECCTTVWLVFNSTARMHCWVLPGSVQLQDYCIRPEKNGELFSCRYRKLYLPQTHPDMLLHPDTPIQPSKEMEDCFPVVIGKCFLRPTQTCKCTCAYLFSPPIARRSSGIRNRSTIPRTCHRQTIYQQFKDRYSMTFWSVSTIFVLADFGRCYYLTGWPFARQRASYGVVFPATPLKTGISADSFTISYIHLNSLNSRQSSILYLTPSISLCQD